MVEVVMVELDVIEVVQYLCFMMTKLYSYFFLIIRRIIQYTELELTKKIETESVPKVTHTELELLFEGRNSFVY